MAGLIRRFAGDESGATSIEYAMIGTLISIVIITVLALEGTRLKNKFSYIGGKLN